MDNSDDDLELTDSQKEWADWSLAVEAFAADAGSASVGRHRRDRNEKPLGNIMAREAGRFPSGDGPGRSRTSAHGFEVRRSIR